MFEISTLQRAIAFAVQVHEIDQKQKRKGSGEAYITHPLTCGLILSSVGASNDVVIAGILHDTIEDSIPKKKVTKEILAQRFGTTVADLVSSVTEHQKDLPWEERKKDALEHIKIFSHDELLVKSADTLSNATDVISAHGQQGDKMFKRFNAPKKDFLQNYLHVIARIITTWPDNPLKEELCFVASRLYLIGPECFILNNPAEIIDYNQYNEDAPIHCSICEWNGTPSKGGEIEYSNDLLDVSCPVCGDMLLIVQYPLWDNSKSR